MFSRFSCSSPIAMSALALSVLASAPSVNASAASPTDPTSSQPNILLIMADDLGYSDLSAFGSEIPTPNIDAIASQGRILTNFHTAAVCSPTRASLMTGVDHHLAGMGNMGEVVGLNITRNHPTSAPWGDSNTYGFDNIPEGYRGHLSEKTITLPELLSDNGYHTYMVGKWHLAFEVQRPDERHKTFYRVKKEALPYARGFEQSFTLLQGGGSHYAPSSQPTPLDMVMYADNEKLLPAKALPKDFYSTEFYTDKLINYIDSNASSDKPFFAYAAYTAPHWPLQAPQEDIAMHKGKYDEGYQVIKHRRFERMKDLGIIPTDATMPIQSNVMKDWSTLSDQERRVEARKMEIYAAMVTNLDRHVGRLVAHLKEIGKYDNTMILFMSDNGAEGADAYVPKIPGTKVDNSFENLGKPSSVVAYGPQWAQVSTTSFRYFKGFTGAEGGTSSPLIVKMPGQQESRPMSDARTQVMDLFPTIADLAMASINSDAYKAKQAYQHHWCFVCTTAPQR